MIRKMKKSYVAVLVILILVIVTLGILLFMSEKKASDNCDACNLSGSSNSNNTGESAVKKEYDCSFTQTYQIVNLLEGTVGAFPELSYIVVKKYQGSPEIHMITNSLKSQLTVGKNYEFTYHMKGTGIVSDLTDVISRLSFEDEARNVPEGSLTVELTIKETDKTGMAQLQEPICEGNIVSDN